MFEVPYVVTCPYWLCRVLYGSCVSLLQPVVTTGGLAIKEMHLSVDDDEKKKKKKRSKVRNIHTFYLQLGC